MRNGKCVQLVQGVPGSEMISLDDPAKVAQDWIRQGARTIHLIDLDGAIEGERKNAPIIEKIVSKAKPEGVFIQVGGGIRSFEDAGALIEMGVDRVILSTAALRDPQLIEKLAQEYGSEHINVALDSKNGKVSIEGWTRESEHTALEMGVLFEDKGAGSILFTNIDTEGLLSGVDAQPTEVLVRAVSIPVIASGGVTTLEDILALKATGAQGVVIGSALYKKHFTLQEALDIVKDNS